MRPWLNHMKYSAPDHVKILPYIPKLFFTAFHGPAPSDVLFVTKTLFTAGFLWLGFYRENSQKLG